MPVPVVVIVDGEDEAVMGDRDWLLVEREPGDWVGFVSATALDERPGQVLDSYGRGLRSLRRGRHLAIVVGSGAVVVGQSLWHVAHAAGLVIT